MQNHISIYDDMKDMPTPQYITPLDNTPPDQSMPKQGDESSAKYSEDIDLHCDLAKRQEHFQQLQE